MAWKRRGIVPEDDLRLVVADDDAEGNLGYRLFVSTLLPLARRHLVDLLIVFAAIVGIVELSPSRDLAGDPRGSLWVLVATVLCLTLPLLARGRLPFAAPAAALVGAGAISFVEGRAVPHTFVAFFAVLACSFLFAFANDRRDALLGLLILFAVGVVVTRNDPESGWRDFLFTMIIFGASWIAGFALNRRLAETTALEQAAREREEAATRAVAEERSRITRELHDVLAHSVSVMTVQASAVRRLLTPEQEREREALRTVEETGRQALAEMRRLLGIMRSDHEVAALAPQPGLGTLPELVEQVRQSGLPVELSVEGRPVALPAGVDLSAYRIVQEALTNALKHAGPAHAWVCVRYTADDVEIEVENDGETDGAGDGAGHGLVGMRERVALCGGELHSGPTPGGGFKISARLPVAGSTA